MPNAAPSLDQLRRYALSRSLFAPTSLPRALAKMGFVQADPLRAPARAQDLILRHRVRGYRAGELERRYPKLDLEEDFFVNYGFMPTATQRLMHPRQAKTVWRGAQAQLAEAVLGFIAEHGEVHPQTVEAHFQQGSARNWFGGQSNACTQLLDGLHFRGRLRTARRESGTRVYALRPVHVADVPPEQALDALADVVLQVYAPLPKLSLNALLGRIRYGAPQWDGLHRAAITRAQARHPSVQVEGQTWYWPQGENPLSRRHAAHEGVRLLAPFDPVVWDRRRFELFWGWPYRFEAYTPAAKRLRGHYALPLLWGEDIIGWGNLSVREACLQAELGYVSGKAPREPAYRLALEAELQNMAEFLGLSEWRLKR